MCIHVYICISSTYDTIDDTIHVNGIVCTGIEVSYVSTHGIIDVNGIVCTGIEVSHVSHTWYRMYYGIVCIRLFLQKRRII